MNTTLRALSDKQRLRIQTRHKVSVDRYGCQPKALYWSNRDVQQVRFQILTEILPRATLLKSRSWSLLDVGCGFADFFGFLNQQDYFPKYTGIDVSPDVVRAAKIQQPEVKIKQGELSDFNFRQGKFDYVMLCGALNEVVETEVEGTAEQQGEYAKSVIYAMYQLCKKGVAFNLLDKRNQWVQSRFDLQSFEPLEIMEYCQSFANEVELIEGYLDNDFTIYLRK